MRASDADRPVLPFDRALTAIVLLWLAGIGLRITLLAVPPVIPMIRDDLSLTATEVGVLTGIPSVLLALAAIPGSLLIARFGAVTTLLVGLFATAAGSALRGIVPNIWFLYAATVLTGFGVAVMQPSLPPLVRAWLPDRIGFGTAVYANGLLVGEIVPVALTLPLVVPATGGGWRGSFVVWAIPCIFIMIAVLLFAPRRQVGGASSVMPGRRWWPDWSDPLLWRVGAMFGSLNATYFTVNAFIPEVLTRTGNADLVSLALTMLNLVQLPASLILLFYAGRIVRRAWPYVWCGIASAVSLLAIMFGSPTVIIIGTTVVGFAVSAAFILMLAVPPLLARPDDVHRFAAGVFTISYSCAVVVPVLSGLAWDVTGEPVSAFVPVLIGALALAVLAPGIVEARKPIAPS